MSGLFYSMAAGAGENLQYHIYSNLNLQYNIFKFHFTLDLVDHSAY